MGWISAGLIRGKFIVSAAEEVNTEMHFPEMMEHQKQGLVLLMALDQAGAGQEWNLPQKLHFLGGTELSWCAG